nr:protein G12-like [Onthophagus taurus]
MKLALVLFAVVALGSAYPTHRDLQGDLEDIVSTIPLSEIRAIARKYAENDAEFQEVVKYLQGPEWAELVQTVADNETWQRFKAYMSEAGGNLYYSQSQLRLEDHLF